ncbi:site-specific DNA-methyltransferase [Neobacillus drentensis]|uniref:site-specific DNA-methyltransferase n=1 Tax=Neobacillus drentensis TaxID=220684 RepID=UPI002FFD9FD5
MINGDLKKSSHILIEADNYHALQLLDYVYPGKVDCIYIDPPYNTGSKDWKYNNDYVDKNDVFRHSKWLSMMEKRLVLSKKILKEDGVLICAIDDNELATLWLLLSELFKGYKITCIPIIHHARGTQGDKFSYTHEYVLFIYKKSSVISDRISSSLGETYRLIRWGSSSERHQGKNCFYPIFVKNNTVVKIGTVPEDSFHPSRAVIEHEDGTLEFWPIDAHGIERKWRYAVHTISGIIDRISISENQGVKQLQIGRVTEKHKTVWSGTRYDANAHGSKLVSDILGIQFPYPKSIYTVFDCIRACTKHNTQAIIVDFFAGSGTTLNSVNLLNNEDNGSRQCIMVTNNEVSYDERKELDKKGFSPGHPEWEKHGICELITFPRSKYTIMGKRDDGTLLSGEYLTNKIIEKTSDRKFIHIGFVGTEQLNTAEKKRQFVELIEGIPKSKIKRETSFFVNDNPIYKAAVLFDDSRYEEFISAVDGNDHITDFYIITSSKKLFTEIKGKISTLMGPISLQENETKLQSDGFEANLHYFKLDFLDPNEVAIGRQYNAILPILWMIAGAKGIFDMKYDEACPWYISEENSFAILNRESRFRDFLSEIRGKSTIKSIFLVTNSEEAFFDMKAELHISSEIKMLYKDYLRNFEINRFTSI